MQRLTRPARIVVAGLSASFAALVVYAVWLPNPTPVSLPVDRGRFQIAEQGRVRADHLDPASTTFRDDKVSLIWRVPFLCGEVNTRSASGGYDGFQRFVSGATVRLYERDIGQPAMDRIWQALCDENHKSGAAR